MNLFQATRRETLDPTKLDDETLVHWARHGVTPEFLQGLEHEDISKNGVSTRVPYLTKNIPHVARMLNNGFPFHRLSELSTKIPLPLYAEGWEQGRVDPSDITKARFTGTFQSQDLEGKKSRDMIDHIQETHRLYPTELDTTEGRYTRGNLGDYVSARIAGATDSQVLNMARKLHPYRTQEEHHYHNQEEGEARSHSPLDIYAKFLHHGGNDQEFSDVFDAMNTSLKPSTAPVGNKATSLRNILGKYTEYRRLGASHPEALDSISKFAKSANGLSFIRDQEDEHYRNSLRSGVTHQEYWNAANKTNKKPETIEDIFTQFD